MLNVVMNAEQLEKDVEAGRWSEVLPALSHLRLPLNKLMNLYEQIILEMLEVREVEVARTMMKETAVLVKMKQTVPERFKHLEDLVNYIGGDGSSIKAAVSSSDDEMIKLLYAKGGRKESRRKEIALELMREIPAVEPSRLLALMTKAIRYSNEKEGLFDSKEEASKEGNATSSGATPASSSQKAPSSSQYDLFLGRFPLDDSEEEKVVRNMASQLSFKSSQSSPESARFSPDGSMLLTGARDGFIEIYNPHTCRLRDDLEFQRNENFMALSSTIMTFSFNKNAQYLLAGSQDGSCAIFRLSTGECVKEFIKIHSGPITSLQFNKDDSSILTASLDGSIHLLGLKSGKVIKSFSALDSPGFNPSSNAAANASTSGSPTFAISAHFNRDNSQVIAAYADGWIRLFASSSAQFIRAFEPGDNPIDIPNASSHDRSSLTPHSSNRASDNDPTTATHAFQKSKDIHSLLPLSLPGQHTFVVGTRSNNLFLMNADGQTLKIYRNDPPQSLSEEEEEEDGHTGGNNAHNNNNKKRQPPLIHSSALASSSGAQSLPSGAFSPFITACLSPQAHLLYAVTQHSYLVCFDVLTGEKLHTFKIHDAEVIGLHHHPFRNLLLSYAVDGSLKTWKT